MENLKFVYEFAASAAVLFVIALIALSYVKARPDTAYIISGLSAKPRILIGRGGFRIPFLERLDTVYLGQITVDVNTGRSVPTNDFINVNVDAVAKIRVAQDNESIQLAAKNFLNKSSNDIAEDIKDSLQGNLREIIGTIELKQLNVDRDGFSDQVLSKAVPDMKKLGIEILSCNIQNITDDKGLIEDLGADNTSKIKKDAAITRSNSERDIAIAQSNAATEANDARVKSETVIAERNNELEIKRSDLKIIADTKKAEADAAYQIQQNEQLKNINIKAVDADIAKTEREQVLTEERIKITENELQAKINKQAEAEAEAELIRRRKAAEAEAYEAQQKAIAIKAEADAAAYEAQQKAIAIKDVGIAEAEAIKAKGIAEAEAMEQKAIAYEKYGNAALVEMIVNVMPTVAQSVSESLTKIGNVNIYGTSGDVVSSMSGNVPVMIAQTMDTLTAATGVNMQDILKSNTINAKTDKNINATVEIPSITPTTFDSDIDELLS